MSEQKSERANLECGIYIWIAVIDPKHIRPDYQATNQTFAISSLRSDPQTVRINPAPPKKTRAVQESISVSASDTEAPPNPIKPFTVRIVHRVHVNASGADPVPPEYVLHSSKPAETYTLPAFESSTFHAQYELVTHMLPTDMTFADAKAWGEKEGAWLTQGPTTVYAFLSYKRFSSPNIRLFTALD